MWRQIELKFRFCYILDQNVSVSFTQCDVIYGWPWGVTLLTVIVRLISASEVSGLNFRGRFLSPEKPRFGLAFEWRVLTVGVDVHPAKLTLQALTGVTCGWQKQGYQSQVRFMSDKWKTYSEKRARIYSKFTREKFYMYRRPSQFAVWVFVVLTIHEPRIRREKCYL